ncbi:MFS transporter [Gluconobacter oxydans]|uniref:MFS transporter n=1 Tax=Gluconobacter oxydans TaxID=442 RepID=UPI0039E8B13D
MLEAIERNKLLFVGSVLAFILMGAGQSLLGPCVPEFRQIFGLSIASASIVVTAQWVGALAGVLGLFFCGQRDFIKLAFGLLTVGSGLMAAQLNWPMTLLGALGFGAGYGASLALVNSRLLESFGKAGPSMVSLVNALFGGGAIVAPLVFVALSRSSTTSFAILTAGLAVPFLLAFRFPSQSGTHETLVDDAPVFRPSFAALFVGASGTAIEACLIGLGPSILVNGNFSDVVAANALSLFFVFFLSGRIALSFVGHRLPAAPMIVAGFAGGAILLYLASSEILPTVTYPLSGFFIGSIFPNFFVFGSALMGKSRKTGPTIVCAALAGGVVGPLVLGQLIAHLQGLTPFLLLAIYASVVCCLGFFVLRKLPLAARA